MAIKKRTVQKGKSKTAKQIKDLFGSFLDLIGAALFPPTPAPVPVRPRQNRR